MNKARYLVVIGIIFMVSIPANSRATDEQQRIYQKLYRASCMVQANDGYSAVTGFCMQKNPLIIAASRDIFEAADHDATWTITRPDWPSRVEVEWVGTAWRDVLFFWRRTSLPSGCVITPLQMSGLPRRGEQLFTAGDFFAGEQKYLSPGEYVGRRGGDYYCRIPITIDYSPGSPVVNGRGALVGILAETTDFRDTGEGLERFEPISELKRVLTAINEKIRGR